MSNTAPETVTRTDKKRVDAFKWLKDWKVIAGIAVVVIIFAGSGIYAQATRFNKNITINGIKVGGLTASQAVNKLASAELSNQVYVGQEKILDGNDTKTGFSNEDLPNVKEVLSKQWTFWPSNKTENFSLTPSQGDPYRSGTMKKQVEDKLTAMNKGLQSPKDAEARLEQGKVVVTKAVDGKQYDVAGILKDYQKQENNAEIHLPAAYIQPVKADSPVIKKEESMLQELMQRTVDYKVQGKDYVLKASDVIQNATVSNDMKFHFDGGSITNKVAEINATQSTLNKNFQFKTHTGAIISVKGESYGWALDVAAESKRIQDAFEKGDNSLLAYNVYGVGWSTIGVGYHTTANGGIGDTYAEVSISEQRIWIYKNGQMVLTTNVVTGRHDAGEDTPKGVWYIMYKQSPSTLTGSEVGNPHYSVKVAYWAPFTNSGCGFHDASWRTNWAPNAYLSAGSGGCVNTPPNVMKSVYDNLTQNEPVVIY